MEIHELTINETPTEIHGLSYKGSPNKFMDSLKRSQTKIHRSPNTKPIALIQKVSNRNI